ncbi:stage III sporulation protein AA [Paludicola sp. MB14-C6]|uniref:stage III sporulation protein AA n=1 Tax=Paludihabitans sp. MB14-C6 TaxID=3070656 RepID=UPI0027DC2520|nr:stage III sporulation protein AA [Paludicola sp. MB14-C6]WMJ23020.1 stage III sporulation protein AA [Paludicola sp. MB14-C6]
MDEKYIQALLGLPKNIASLLRMIPNNVQQTVREICLRINKPLVLATFEGDQFLTKSGQLSCNFQSNIYIVSKQEMEECLHILTEYSVHSYIDKINMGFITIEGGHRAGIVGSCVLSGDKIISISDISSINLRIARQVKGVAKSLVQSLYSNRLYSTLIVGAPASGKTTLLRDCTRLLSDGILGFYIKISVIDERGEIAAVKSGVPQNDVGIMTDVLDGYKKGEGMTIAIRSMSPKAIILDEIGSYDDAYSIRQGLNAGVVIIATTHASSMEELRRKKYIYELVNEGAFERIILLHGSDKPCVVKEIINMELSEQNHIASNQKGKEFYACLK